MSRRGGVTLYLGLAVLLVGAARPVEAYLVRLRAEKDADGYSLAAFAPAGGRPAVEAISTACLGGTRGIIADLLWMRAIRMQEEGRSYEIVALLDGILQMQPHFTSVWAYQGHVLVFDFGSALENPDPAESYRWIRRGLDVLEEGARKNPTSCRLEFEMASAYQRKLSPFSVDKKTWLMHVRSWEEELVRRAEKQGGAKRWPKELGDWYAELVARAEKEGLKDKSPRAVRRWYDEHSRRSREQGRGDPVFDRHLGLKLARNHYLRAAGKPDATRNRRLLSRRMAIRCLERMGHWPQAERGWVKILEYLVDDQKVERDSPVYLQHQRFFRGFMRQWAALLLEQGDGTGSRAVYGRMKRHFAGTPGYLGVLAQEVRSRRNVRDERGARALHKLMREKLGERRSYQQIIGGGR